MCVEWLCIFIIKNNPIFVSMQKHRHIKALFFLSIFSMLLLHQFVPHWHHHQDELEHTHKTVAHNDDHSHHHEIPEIASPIKGFFDLFLDIHVHSMVSNEILLTRHSSIKLLKVKKDISTAVSNKHYSSSINYVDKTKLRIFHPLNTYFNPYRSSLDSRGPPYFG